MQNLETAELEKQLAMSQEAAAGEASIMAAAAQGNAPSVPNQLWVDAYAPKSYLQLLSMEGVNATVLSWLKSWDSTVFPTAVGADGAMCRLSPVCLCQSVDDA